MINGRSMPDDMDPNYAPQYPHQPYNGNPHMHPGEQVLLRIIGQGRWQHPFHEHGNHVRILARDGNLIVSQTDPNELAGPLLFTTTTTPGLAMDGIFYWTGKGLNWDAYGHNPHADAIAKLDLHSGRATATTPAARHRDQLLRVVPGSQQAAAERIRSAMCGAGGPVTLPDPNHLRQRRLVWRQPLPGTGCDGARSRPHRHHAAIRHRSPTPLPTKPASPSCGTRITSARSPPTTFSRAE